METQVPQAGNIPRLKERPQPRALCKRMWKQHHKMNSVRPCENRPELKQKSLAEDRPNGPDPGLSSNSQDARHVAHIGHDAEEAEMNQLSRFQHLEKMVKLIATHIGLGQNSDPICSDANDGSDPDWSPDDDQDYVDVVGDAPEPPSHQKRRKTNDPLCSENKHHVAERDSIFFHPLDMFDVDDSVTQYVSNYLYSTISDDSFKAIKKTDQTGSDTSSCPHNGKDQVFFR